MLSIGITLIDSVDAEAAFLGERGDISLNGVENTLAIISFSELRHESFTLDLAYYAISQVCLEMIAYLSKIFAVLDRDYEQEAVLFTSFGSDAPAASHCERKVEDVLVARGGNSQNCKLDIRALF